MKTNELLILAAWIGVHVFALANEQPAAPVEAASAPAPYTVGACKPMGLLSQLTPEQRSRVRPDVLNRYSAIEPGTEAKGKIQPGDPMICECGCTSPCVLWYLELTNYSSVPVERLGLSMMALMKT